MELLQLKYFCALAHNEHLTRTAEQLRISPPSLSATISKLEKEIGVPLFDRKGRAISLNRYGMLFYETVSRALGDLEDVQKKIMDLHSMQNRQTVRVGVCSMPVWQSLLDYFQEHYPSICMQAFYVSPFDLKNPIQEQRADFYLGIMRDIPLDQYETMQLQEPQKPVVVVSNEHPLANETSICLTQLKEDTFLTLGQNNPSAHKYTLDMLNAAGIDEPNILEVDYYYRVKLLLENRGVVLSTEDSVQYVYSDPTKSKIISVADPVIHRVRCIAWRKNAYLSQSALFFREFVREYCS